MDPDERAAIREAVVERAEAVIAGVEQRWGEVRRLDPLPVEPLPHHDVRFPESVAAFYEEYYEYAAGAVVTDESGRLLCVDSEARDEWETPGGSGDPGETPAETARRETREESGVDPEITGVLFARTMEIDLGTPERLPVPVLVFTGEHAGGALLDGAAVADHGEVNDVTWFEPAAVPTDLRGYEPIHDYLTSHAGTDASN